MTYSAKTGWGGTFRYERALMPRLNATATMSLVLFGRRSISSPSVTLTTKYTMVPIQVGLKYFLVQPNPTKGLFVNGELGVHRINTKGTFNGADVPIDADTNFSYSLGIGYRIRRVELSYKRQFVSGHDITLNYSDFRLSLFLNNKNN